MATPSRQSLLNTLWWATPRELADAESRITETLDARIDRLERIMAGNADRLDTALTGITGDVHGLKDKADALQAALDAALADQGAAVQEAVTAAVQQAQADFDASLGALADRADALDAETPAAEEPAPVEPAPPVEEPTP